MKASLQLVGEGRHPVLVIDDATGHMADVVQTAAALAPFGMSMGTHYPGLRRILTAEDTDAFAYVHRLLSLAEPLIGGGFHLGHVDLLEASFSMVTTPPEALTAPQRAPHFDSTDPNYLAILHYLNDLPGTGTAFFRQCSTGIEAVNAQNAARYHAAAHAEAPGGGYIHGSTAHYEQIGTVAGIPDRLVIYRGCMLHSGIIPPGMTLSDDPRSGRLTANIFVHGR